MIMSEHPEGHSLIAGETASLHKVDSSYGQARGSSHQLSSESCSFVTEDVQDNKKYNMVAGFAWRPGIGRSLPWSGVLALLGCLAGIVASATMLHRADGSEQTAWAVSPTVILSAVLAVTNMLARFAFSNGVRIAWWREALGGGTGIDKSTTVGKLQTCWSHADSFVSAICAGRHFGMVALAAIAVTLVAIDQPLLQRAVTVVTGTRTSSVNITATIAPEIPWTYTSYQSGRGDEIQLMTDPMVVVFNAYNRRDSIPAAGVFSGCRNGANCTGFVEAGGLAPECNTTRHNVTYWAADTMNMSNVGQTESSFSIVWDLDGAISNDLAPITLNIAFSRAVNLSTLTFERTEHSCLLYSATLRYNIMLTAAGTVSLLGGDGGISTGATVVSRQPPSTLQDGDDQGDFSFWTLGGLYVAAKLLFTSNATYTWGGGIGVYLTLPDAPSYQFLNSVPSSEAAGNSSYRNVSLAGQPSWTDPKDYVLSALDTMAFMLSISAAGINYRNTSAPSTPRAWSMEEELPVNVYHIDRGLLASGIAVTGVLVLLIAPTFVGWWELGRPVTLNPVETAKAFDAPLLRGPGSNAPIQDLVAIVGGRKLRWGDVVEGSKDGNNGARRRLGFAPPELVSAPRRGILYE